MVATEHNQRDITLADVVPSRPLSAIGMAAKPIRAMEHITVTLVGSQTIHG